MTPNYYDPEIADRKPTFTKEAGWRYTPITRGQCLRSAVCDTWRALFQLVCFSLMATTIFHCLGEPNTTLESLFLTWGYWLSGVTAIYVIMAGLTYLILRHKTLEY